MRIGVVRLLTASALLGATALTGCGATADGASDGRPSVAAAFYPLAFVAERVAGTEATVTNLTAAGTEPHDLELSPQQVGSVAESDLVVYEKGFQPSVDEAVEQNAPAATLRADSVVPLRNDSTGAADPHLWLDPTRLAKVALATGNKMATSDPKHADGYRERARALADDLTALDREYTEGLQRCDRRVIVTSHDAFGYLADRYDLRQVPVTGLDPEAEPSPGRLAEVQRVVESSGATTVFFETLVSPRIAKTLAHDAGVRTAVLDPLEGLEDDADGDYLSVMRQNLHTLQKALGCR